MKYVLVKYVTETKVLNVFAATKRLWLDFRRSLGGRRAGWFPKQQLVIELSKRLCCLLLARLNHVNPIIQLQILQTDLQTFP